MAPYIFFKVVAGKQVVLLSCQNFKCGAPKGIRTPGLLLRRQLLYPAELLAHKIETIKVSIKMERVMGIEPTQPAWKAGVLPLNYTRITCDG